MFGVYGIEIPGTHFEDQNTANGNNPKIMDEIKYLINNQQNME
jgi:hypothetical protein